MPEIKTIEIHVPIKSIDCPKSGWLINKIIIDNNIKKLKKYVVLEVLVLFEVKIFAVNKIKKGFISSMGCSLKKYKLNHLLDPFTSIPIIGTSNKIINNIIKIGKIVFFKIFKSINEIKNIIHKEKTTKIECLKKKK